jgi:hypothetical protein
MVKTLDHEATYEIARYALLFISRPTLYSGLGCFIILQRSFNLPMYPYAMLWIRITLMRIWILIFLCRSGSRS